MTLRILAGRHLERLPEQTLLESFDPTVRAFCHHLSEALLRHPEARQHPELAALGFWLRDSHLLQLQLQFGDAPRGRSHRPVGLVMHFTPANVDTMFVYSWICSLLMGNTNLVRLSSEDSAVKSLLLQVLNTLFERPEHAGLAERNVFVSYPRDDDVASELSIQADARVIWGGDDAVQAIRRLPCKPRCRDIPFADRYSAALINGDAITESDVESLADRLWRDIHPYQQMACSSPRVVFWLGTDQYLEVLWGRLNRKAMDEQAEVIRRTEHLVLSQTLQARGDSLGPSLEGVVSFIPVQTFSADLMALHPGQGICYLVPVTSLDHLGELDDRCQSLGYWGVRREDLEAWVNEAPGGPLDRIVPIGRALDFSPAWDGFELFGLLSRTTVIQ